MAFKSFLVPLKQGFLRLFVVLVLYPILLACSEPQSDEQLIRTALDKMSQAVKVKQRQDLLAYLSHDFRGQQRMSKADINGLIFYHFRRNQQLVIVLSGVTVEVKVGQAMVSAIFCLAEQMPHFLSAAGCFWSSPTGEKNRINGVSSLLTGRMWWANNAYPEVDLL